jgi:hypothetical protein
VTQAGIHVVMSTAKQAEQLRARARHLRSLSSAMSTNRALTVYSLAGPETWVGPTAQACFDALIGVRRELQTQQQSLGDTARRLDRQADELERSRFHTMVS